MSHHLIALCLVVATFESPIGQSIEGYVIQHTVSWCPDYYDGPRITVKEQVVDNKTGKTIGAPRERIFSLPTKDKPATEVVPVDPEVTPWGIRP